MANSKVYKRFFLETPIGLYRTRCVDGLFLDINPFGAKLLGFDSPEDLIGKVFSASLYPEDEREKLLQCLREHRELTDYEVQLICKDGSSVWVSLTARNGGEEIIGSFCSISDRKLLEAELAQYRQQLEVVAKQAKKRLAAFESKIKE